MVEIVNPLSNGIEIFRAFGFFNVILPFILVYAIVFGVLLKTKIFGDPEKDTTRNISNVIALATGFFVISATDVVEQMIGVIPQATFMLVIVLFLLMIYAMLGLNADEGLFGSNSILSSSTLKAAAFGVIILVFLLMIDAGSPTGIPILRGLNEILLGNQAFGLEGSEAMNMIIGLSFAIGIPLTIIMFLSRSNN
jgi:hypothetical protein